MLVRTDFGKILGFGNHIPRTEDVETPITRTPRDNHHESSVFSGATYGFTNHWVKGCGLA